MTIPNHEKEKYKLIMNFIHQLSQLKIQSPDMIMVHASMRRIGGRAEYLLDQLLTAIQPAGTLVAYVDYHPTEEIPWFDPSRSPAVPDYGIFAETVRRHPDALRSLNPGASVAAIGSFASELCKDQPLDFGYGEGSPFEKLVQGDGKVLLLGSDFDHVTLLHYAEHIADLPDKRLVTNTYKRWTNSNIEIITCQEFDTGSPVVKEMPENYFQQLIEMFVTDNPKVITGPMGNTTAWVLPARDLVEFAVGKMVDSYG